MTIVLLFLVLCGQCGAQAAYQNKRMVGDAPGKTQYSGKTGTTEGQVSREESPSQNVLLQVLFATNDDCQLFINDEPKGTISKDDFLYLQLTPGNYRYTARSQSTGDLWRDTFSIREDRPNEIFIDLLYAIDLEIERKIKAGRKSTVSTATAIQNKKKLPVQQAGDKEALRKEMELETINFLVANLVPVQGGKFVMGNNRSPSADEAEHGVQLNTFMFSKYEVTQEQWESIMGYNPSINKNCPTCPVENVSWEEVMVFIRKINAITNKNFRLPTEAEWEYVAKLGGRAEIERAGGAEEYIKKTAWNFMNAENKTHPIGKKQPNDAGVYDLIGNVSEWCMDWYGAFFYKEDFTEKNPGGPPLGKDKVIRGGNYKDHLGDRFRPSFRNKMNPKSKSSEVGFRLVMDWQN